MTRSSAMLGAGLILGLAAAVSAQDSPYIPSTGVSATCSAFLDKLDSNSELARCSSNLLAATALFDPSSSGSSSSSSSSIDSTLNRLCSPASQCSKSTITQALTWFSGNCTAELASNQALVRSNYDVLYVLYPFTRAVCTKDPKSSEFCATRVTDENASKATPVSSNNTTTTTTASGNANSTVFANGNGTSTTTQSGLFVQAPRIALTNLYIHVADAAKSAVSRLRRRQAAAVAGASSLPSTGAATNSTGTTTTTTSNGNAGMTAENALMPNATTFRDTNIPFLFLSGEMGQAQLCTDCTKEILAAYVGFETDFPYGSGLSNSPMLGAQAALWNDMGKVCGSGFLSAITSQSGSNSFSGASHTSAAAGGMVVILLAAVFGFMAVF